MELKKIEKNNNFIEFIKKSKWQIAIILFFIIFAFGERIISQSFSIDTELYIQDIGREGRWDWWIILNRWGLVLLNKVFQMDSLPIFASNFLTATCILAYSILFNYLFYINLKEEYKEKFIKYQFIFPIIFITNPVFAEQYNFILQNVSVAFTVMLIPIIILMLDKIENPNISRKNKIINTIIAMFLLILSFGVYQSVILLYIVTVVVCYLLKVIKENDNSWKYLGKHIGIFLLSAIIYLGIGKVLAIGQESSSYLQLAWLKDSIKQCLINIKNCIIPVLKCDTIFYNIGYWITILSVGMLIGKLVKDKKMKIGIAIGSVGLLLAPFYIMIITGVDQLKRTQFNYSFVIGVALLFLVIGLDKFKKLDIVKKVIIGISLAIAFTQSYYSANLFHTVDVTYENDKMFAQRLISRIEEQEWYDRDKEYKLIFLGRNKTEAKNVYLKSEVIGSSFFDFDYQYIYGLNSRAIAFLDILGYKFNNPTEEDFENAKRKIEQEPIKAWPSKECIQLEDENKIIIRLSEEY